MSNTGSAFRGVMFNLIAQYIGYGTDSEATQNASESQDCSFGDVDDGDWTLVDIAKCGDAMNKSECAREEEYQRVSTPVPLDSLSWSMTEAADSRVKDLALPATPAPVSERRIRCTKSNKKHRMNMRNLTQQRPNQMKRSNQVFCQRSTKIHQKMRQIVHQPKKF